MIKILFILIGSALSLIGTAQAKTTLFQCAVDHVRGGGARINIIENNGVVRANLIFGTTVSGVMYAVQRTQDGFIGQIKNKPEFTLELAISRERGRNSNIAGYKAYLKAVYPDLNKSAGFDIVEGPLICGEKIADRLN